jgi:hypothetical protein
MQYMLGLCCGLPGGILLALGSLAAQGAMKREQTMCKAVYNGPTSELNHYFQSPQH